MDSVEDKINEAITRRHRVLFHYDGHSRCAEPHHYGLLNGIKHLHAYQVSNGSASGHLPQWRNFRLSGIKNLVVAEHAFNPRGDHHPDNAHYSQIFNTVTPLKSN
ncbi:hypothetical protein GH742_00180 [Legionella sp. MW5194]|uniref:WYL domain-containing protein n=1 Tax=Legionella sp. MW5194 TaxID=2662448 RepID=UPI00193E6729|nr:WYL domain-containing protein [Legionella sp. MW5194]QRN02422.1 hypothetical protein GH742_00180 [Legionella sp. MW5194]